MGLLDLFRKNTVHDFNEYVNSLSQDEKKALLESFSKWGDPQKILESVLNTAPCCLNKDVDVRINEYIFFKFQKKATKGPRFFLYKMKLIPYCYHSHCRNGKLSQAGMLTPTGSLAVGSLDLEDSLAVYAELRKYAQYFERLPDTEHKDEELIPSYDSLHGYYFKGDTLYARRHTEIKKVAKDSVKIPNIQDIIWCEQWFTWDSEASDTYALDLYMLNQKEPVTLYAGSESGAFYIAMELKKRVHHLMYGPNEEYKAIFKRDPNELMALAKSKMNR